MKKHRYKLTRLFHFIKVTKAAGRCISLSLKTSCKHSLLRVCVMSYKAGKNSVIN
jgi:hypothetical protein